MVEEGHTVDFGGAANVQFLGLGGWLFMGIYYLSIHQIV